MSTNTREVFHISFNDKLPKILKPRQPDGVDEDIDELVENLPDRVSFSPTVEQCWYGIYPNIKKYFEDKKFDYPWITMYVYKATIKSNTKVIPESEVAKAVEDFSLTGEVCVVEPISVKLFQRINIKNPKGQGNEVSYYPFNDKSKPKVNVGYEPQITVIEQYDDSLAMESEQPTSNKGKTTMFGLTRDPEFINNNIVEKQGTYFTALKTAIEFPSWYVDKKMASFGELTSFYGIFITIMGDKYAVSRIPTLVRSNPISITSINRGGIDFVRLEYGENDPLFYENKAIQETLLSYEFFNNFFIRPKIPWFVEYFDLIHLLNNLLPYSGSNVGTNPLANELLVSFVTRLTSNKDIYFRQSNMLMNYTYVGLMNMYHAIKSMSGKLGGGYLQEALVSALVSKEGSQSSRDLQLKG